LLLENRSLLLNQFNYQATTLAIFLDIRAAHCRKTPYFPVT